VGTLTWLRATVSRFAAGADHARRRAHIVELLPAAAGPEAAAQDIAILVQAGPRACPGRERALALAQGVLEPR
jgi:hypothetical protein